MALRPSQQFFGHVGTKPLLPGYLPVLRESICPAQGHNTASHAGIKPRTSRFKVGIKLKEMRIQGTFSYGETEGWKNRLNDRKPKTMSLRFSSKRRGTINCPTCGYLNRKSSNIGNRWSVILGATAIPTW